MDEATKQIAAVESATWVLENLREGAPGYVAAADALCLSLGHLPRSQPLGATAEAKARHRLANHAANDALELVVASFHGSGRSMLRSARSLFEVAVAALDLAGDEALSERYLTHDAVGRRAAVNLTRLDPYFSPKGRRSLRHRRRTVTRDADVAIRHGTARWGKRWPRDWAPRPLRDRASAHGLLDDYESFYRLASLPTHGASGGLFGTFDADLGNGVHRFGPALEACPVALIYGLAYVRLIVEALGPLPDLGPLLAALEEVEKEIGQYGAVILWLDESLWPESAPPGRLAVLSVYRGNWRWLVHDLEMAKVADATPPDHIPDAQRRSIETTIQLNENGPLSITEPLVIGVVGVDVRPRPGATWIREEDVLPSRPLFVRPSIRDSREQPPTDGA